MASTPRTNYLAKAKQFATTAASYVRSTGSAAYARNDFFYILIPLLIIVISAIGLVVAQVANCTFQNPLTDFLFGLKPGDRILG